MLNKELKNRLYTLPKELLVEIIEKQNCIEYLTPKDCLQWKIKTFEKYEEMGRIARQKLLDYLQIPEDVKKKINSLSIHKFENETIKLYCSGKLFQEYYWSGFTITYKKDNFVFMCENDIDESSKLYLQEIFYKPGTYGVFSDYFSEFQIGRSSFI